MYKASTPSPAHNGPHLRIFAAIAVAVTALILPVAASYGDTLFIEEMTSAEVAMALQRGVRTIIVPTGGIEQGGPHLITAKHNHIVRHTAAAVAQGLGDALVAPVVVYVPQGQIEPPQGHMKFPGTVSLPEPVFKAVLENIARSFKAHGFTEILFLGDSGGNQRSQNAVADKLNQEWAGTNTRALHLSDYYDPEANGQFAWMRQNGLSTAAIPGHGDLRDTSELMAVYPNGVRGQPHGASATLGRIFLDLQITAALSQVRRWRAGFKN